MPQETMIVALSAIGPVIGSGIGVLKRPTTAYIHNMLYFAAGIMLAIAIHNIPEGICTSAPHYFTYGNWLKSFSMSSLSALPIVAGYIAARYLFVQISPQIMSLLVGSTAGLMIYVAADELMPAARNESGTQTIIFFIFGIIAVMLLEIVA